LQSALQDGLPKNFFPASNIIELVGIIQDMQRFFSRLRVFLLTFTFGLAGVPFFNGIYEQLSEIPVDLPPVRSEALMIVSPKYRTEIPYADNVGCGGKTIMRAKRARRN
jgi:hypothetical protein